MRKLLILFAMVVVTMPLSAQWRRGGLFGADVRALVADPSDADTLYLGTSTGEVYVSRDGAKSWSMPRNGVPFPNHVVEDLLIDRDGRLWAGAWGLWGGGVVAVSRDGGRTWERRDAGLEDFAIRAIAIDPNDASFVLAGGLTGVYRSTDAGRTWEKISDQENVESLGIDPRTRDRIYVGTWRQGWRTEDGGKSWKHIAEGMVLDTDMFTITIDRENPDNIWVATCGWVYNSLDRGDKWTRYKDGFNNRRIHDVEIDPANRNIVYAGSVAGLYRSIDAGKNWSPISDEALVINRIVLHPARPNRIVIGVEGDGVYVSHDRGVTYQRSADGLHNLRITTVASDPFVKDRVYAAVAFGGAASGIYRSDDSGATWTRASRTPLPEVLTLTIASETDAEVRFLAGTQKGFFWSNDAAEWTQAEPTGFPIRVDRIQRFNRLRSFAATAEGVFTTRDGGRNWYRLAGATNRAVDIAIGMVGRQRVLFALTAAGLEVFDGTRWMPVEGAPSKGRTIALRSGAGSELLFIAGLHGVRAGSIGEDYRWIPAEAPDAQYAVVHGGTRAGGQMLFLTSRAQHGILVGEPSRPDWSELALPMRNTEITSVVPDPFVRNRYYVGTLGGGVYVYEGGTTRIAVRETNSAAAASRGGRW